MLVSIAILYFLALLQPLFHPFDREKIGWLIGFVPLILTFEFWSQADIVACQPVTETYSWVPSLGLIISFRLDSLALLFVLIILGIGTFIIIYSGSYLKNHPELSRFYAFLLIFMASMLGLVLAENLILAFIFWELTTIASYLLIGFHHELKGAREAAQKALVITTFAGLALLVGILLIGDITGSYEITDMLAKSAEIKAHSHYSIILLLIALGAFAKSAQVPFHFWLPGAMAAPTPVSAYLHSATMVNAGIYLLARLSPVLGGTSLWTGLLGYVGFTTMLLGAILSFFPKDLKLILAYSTISLLGMMVALLGIGTQAAQVAAIFLLLSHSLYKASIFLVAGSIDHQCGTRDIRKLWGLGKVMPYTAFAALLAALSNGGLPPFLGFLGKEVMLTSLIQLDTFGPLLLLLLILSAAFLVSASIIVGLVPFFASLRTNSVDARGAKPIFEVPWAMRLGPLVLGLLGFYWGIFPNSISEDLLFPAAAVIHGGALTLQPILWHGVHPSMYFSIGILVLGLLIFLYHRKLTLEFSHFRWLKIIDPAEYYDGFIAFLKKFALTSTKVLQNGQLNYYLLTIVFTASTFVLFEIWADELYIPFNLSGTPVFAYVFSLLVFSSLILAIISKRFVTAVLSLSFLGAAMVLFFAYFSAPDLALTQALVEVLSLLLLFLVLAKLPRYQSSSSKFVRIRDGAVSLLFGGSVTISLLLAETFRSNSSISQFYIDNAFYLAKGRNIVNVILVDFRGLDTLGEITVIAVAGIGVFSLVGLKIVTKKENP